MLTTTLLTPVLRLNVNESITSIVVKLEGESKTRLGSDYVPGGYGRRDRYERGQTEIEIHKVGDISKFCTSAVPNLRSVMTT